MPFYQTFFPTWFIFYYIGLMIKIKGHKIVYKNNQLLISLIICITTLILSIFEGYILLSLRLPESAASSQIKISSFLYTLAVIKMIMVLEMYIQNKKNKWLKYIGDNSYGIYYIHMFWIGISNKVLIVIPELGEILPIYELLQFIFVLCFSIISIYVTHILLGKKLPKKLLGF